MNLRRSATAPSLLVQYCGGRLTRESSSRRVFSLSSFTTTSLCCLVFVVVVVVVAVVDFAVEFSSNLIRQLTLLLLPADTFSLDFVINRFFVKLFQTNNIEIVRAC